MSQYGTQDDAICHLDVSSCVIVELLKRLDGLEAGQAELKEEVFKCRQEISRRRKPNEATRAEALAFIQAVYGGCCPIYGDYLFDVSGTFIGNFDHHFSSSLAGRRAVWPISKRANMDLWTGVLERYDVNQKFELYQRRLSSWKPQTEMELR